MREPAWESGLGEQAEGSPLEGSPLKGAGRADAAEETGPRRARCGDPEAAPFLTWANRCPSLTSAGRAGGRARQPSPLGGFTAWVPLPSPSHRLPLTSIHFPGPLSFPSPLVTRKKRTARRCGGRALGEASVRARPAVAGPCAASGRSGSPSGTRCGAAVGRLTGRLQRCLNIFRRGPCPAEQLP